LVNVLDDFWLSLLLVLMLILICFGLWQWVEVGCVANIWTFYIMAFVDTCSVLVD
jgi:hypothetical protein